MNAEEMNARLAQSLAEQIKVYPCNNLRASNLGHPCERYLYLLITRWDEQKNHSAGLQSTFNLGNKIEEFTISTLKTAGFEVITPTQRSWKIDKPLITGRDDIRVKDERGELVPVEIKGLSPAEFDRINTIEDFKRSKRHYVRAYPAQLQIYMLYFAKEKGFFALTNKLTGEVKIIEMPFDYDYAEALLKKAERIYTAIEEKKAPEPCGDCSVCENCGLQHICGNCVRNEADIDVSAELEEALEKREKLAPYKKEYEEADEEVKRLIGERERVITGNYLVERKQSFRRAFTVPEGYQWRISIKKL